MKAIVPFKKEGAKSRLSRLLTRAEREELALRMLNDVLVALSRSEVDEVEILTTGDADELMEEQELKKAVTEVRSDSRGLNEALNAAIAEQEQPVLILMADIPLVTPESINKMIERTEDVVVAPGRKGGTNALLLRKPSLFSVSYYGISCIEHLNIARMCNLTCGIHDSFFMSIDIDEVDDLTELLIHGLGSYSALYLDEIGVHLHANKGSEVHAEVVR